MKRTTIGKAMTAAAACLLLSMGAALAVNIDPGNVGDKYAWSENGGWMDAKPGGDTGQGVEVANAKLTGFIWSENFGWISLSCQNTDACGTSSYGVFNDGLGNLSGYAWGENVGWINFSPKGGGVVINSITGEFSGSAWGENVGWIKFAAIAPVAFRVKTSWILEPAACFIRLIY
ncbi:MAG: hypothetical protein AB1921_17915 [Thermodesulfobacteriota bacterium]